jgi:hypothetical protein
MDPNPDTAITLKDYMPLLSVVIGGLLAILGGFASTIFVEWRRNARESKKLAFAFRGEIQALSTLVKKRGYAEGIEAHIKHMEQTNQPLFLQIDVRREYFNIFISNIKNIGILKNPLPELIAKFYVQANSILEDFQSYREGVWHNASVEDLISSHKELLLLIKETFSLADEIVDKIGRLYS